MNKLLNLKQRLTVSEAARYLSMAISEPVSESDILYFGLSGDIQLSVELVNGALVRRGVFADDEAKKKRVGLDSTDIISFSPGIELLLDEELTNIRGVYELPLIGGEQIYVTTQYQSLVGGPEVDLLAMNGAFIQRGIEFYQLHSYFDDREDIHASEAWLKEMKENKKGEEEHLVKSMLSHYEEDRRKLLEFAYRREGAWYFPASSLPEDSTLVVRITALRDFLKSLEGESASENNARPLTTTERNTLLVIIAALCKGGGIEHQSINSASQIERLTEKIGVKITDETIRKHLLKIPDVIAARSK